MREMTLLSNPRAIHPRHLLLKEQPDLSWLGIAEDSSLPAAWLL